MLSRRHLNFPLNRGQSFFRCIFYLKMAWMSTKDCVAAVLLCKQQAKEKRDQSWEDAALKLRPSAATGFGDQTVVCMLFLVDL